MAWRVQVLPGLQVEEVLADEFNHEEETFVIVDSHVHVISPDTVRFPHAPVGGRQSDWSKKHTMTYDELVLAMDDAGIEAAVVVQASTVYGHNSSYVVEAVRAHPDRFVGVFSIDAPAPDAVEQIKRWTGEGLSGLRLFTTGTTMPGQSSSLGDPASYPAWAYAEEHGISLCLQMTSQGLPVLRGLLERFPKATVLLDHLARPDPSEGPPYTAVQPLFDMAELPGVHLKLTNRTIASAAQGKSTPAAFVEAVVGKFGAERIAWGSNFPAAEDSLKNLLGEAQAALAFLPETQRDLIFSGVAARLYPSLGALADA
jgi:predicted TIM-barrel fold metal-dependent hydrolase